MINRDFGTAQVKRLNLKSGTKLVLNKNEFLFTLTGNLQFENEVKGPEILWEIKDQIEIESLTNSTSIKVSLILKNSKHRV
jgi:hypothetical protein